MATCLLSATALKAARIAISVFPNPVSDQLFFEQNYFTNDFNVSITDMSGKVLLESVNNSTIDVNSLASGNYIFVLSDGKNTIQKTFLKK